MNYIEGTTLLRNVPDLPGESLLSRITRMATANYLPSSQPIFASMGQKPGKNARTIFADEVQHVAAVLGLTCTATKAMTLHAFAEQIAAPHERCGTWLTPEFLGAIVAPLRYCPGCLAEQPYHRLVWEIKWLPICLDHQCFLRDRCPHCQRKLSLMSLIHGQCQHCVGHLSKTPYESAVDPQTLAIVTLFKGWLQREEPTILASWHVPTAPSAVLLSLWVWLLRRRNHEKFYTATPRQDIGRLREQWQQAIGANDADFHIFAGSLRFRLGFDCSDELKQRAVDRMESLKLLHDDGALHVAIGIVQEWIKSRKQVITGDDLRATLNTFKLYQPEEQKQGVAIYLTTIKT